jgi:hypothetical protein
VDDLLADALVPQGRPGALEIEVHTLALLADEGLEGSRQPAPAAHWAPDLGQRLEASAAQEITRPLLAAHAALRVEEVDECGDIWFEGASQHVSSSVRGGAAVATPRSKNLLLLVVLPRVVPQSACWIRVGWKRADKLKC